MYFSCSVLTGIIYEIIRAVAPSCTAVELRHIPGPYRFQNWQVSSVSVSPDEEAIAQHGIVAIEESRHWIMVPDGHQLDGQVIGMERARRH